jgi:hypothetical protein
MYEGTRWQRAVYGAILRIGLGFMILVTLALILAGLIGGSGELVAKAPAPLWDPLPPFTPVQPIEVRGAVTIGIAGAIALLSLVWLSHKEGRSAKDTL